jgi:hypothetical protein
VSYSNGRLPWLVLALALALASACAGDAAPVANSSASAARVAGPAATLRPAAVTPPAQMQVTAPPPHGPAVAPGWVGPLYPPRQHGYDISYPQCPATAGPPGAALSIIGVNKGKAFTANPCLAGQWRSAQGRRAVYLNSGYEADNLSQASADCRARSQALAGAADRQAAYAIGCSEALFAVSAMRTAGADRAVMVWLDVESANSWDLANVDLNRTSLQAEIDVLAAYGHLVGLYSTFALWHGILGDWSPAGIVADWVAGGTPQIDCAAPGFSGHPVWVAQELPTWDGRDSDWTC